LNTEWPLSSPNVRGVGGLCGHGDGDCVGMEMLPSRILSEVMGVASSVGLRRSGIDKGCNRIVLLCISDPFEGC
jgi:hypothetical protein